MCWSISRSSLEGEGVALSLLLHPLMMSSERCWLLGMIVFGLVTSAARHVSHDGAGAIRLEVWVTARSVACAVTDNGMANDNRKRDRSTVETLVARLNGTVDIYAGADGTRTVVKIPRQA